MEILHIRTVSFVQTRCMSKLLFKYLVKRCRALTFSPSLHSLGKWTEGNHSPVLILRPISHQESFKSIPVKFVVLLSSLSNSY